MVSASKNTCRLCLNKSVLCYSLHDKNGTKMYESLTNIKISDDDFPKTACVKCWLNLKLAYQYQQNFIETYKILRDNYDNSSVKQEENESNVSSIIDLCESFDTEVEEIVVKVEDNTVSKYSKKTSSEHNTFTCAKCKIEFQDLDSIKVHVCLEPFKEKVQCQLCHLKFHSKLLYNSHCKTVHSKRSQKIPKTSTRNKKELLEDSVLQCPICCRTFNDAPSYKKHIHIHRRKKCPICSAEITAYNFSKHVSNHASTPAICHLCGATCKNAESLRGHMYHNHSEKTLPCPICGKMFTRGCVRDLHIKKQHTGEKNHICDKCGKRFITAANLNKHVNMTHLKLRPFECQHCKKFYSSRHALRTHLRQHTNEAPYKCHICGHGFRQNVSLKYHLKSKHLIVEKKTVKCEKCDKMFVDDWALKSHMRLHD